MKHVASIDFGMEMSRSKSGQLTMKTKWAADFFFADCFSYLLIFLADF